MNEMSICVFTTRKVVIERSPILRIVYDDDGDWQFFAENDIPSSQSVMLISMDEILQIDKSIEEIMSLLSVGQTACRKSKKSPWIID